MPSNAQALLEQLHAAFDGEVVLLETPPKLFTAPSIVVTPGDPFLEPATIGQPGAILERWEVLAVVSMTEPAVSVPLARDLSLAVRFAVSRAGGKWVSTSGARRPAGDTERQTVFFVNTVEFKWLPLAAPTP